MPAMNGIEVATIGYEQLPATVFVTAYEHYAVRAFEANAVDYCVKPFSRERFRSTLGRAKARPARSDDFARIVIACGISGSAPVGDFPRGLDSGAHCK
jgi:two-component system, LytTR family, response regulator